VGWAEEVKKKPPFRHIQITISGRALDFEAPNLLSEGWEYSNFTIRQLADTDKLCYIQFACNDGTEVWLLVKLPHEVVSISACFTFHGERCFYWLYDHHGLPQRSGREELKAYVDAFAKGDVT
jgi:hypothetical protein